MFQQCEEFGKYQSTCEDVHEEDGAMLRIIDDILAYSQKHKEFKTDFVDSVSDLLEKKGCITSTQYNALVKIYYSFVMGEEEFEFRLE